MYLFCTQMSEFKCSHANTANTAADVVYIWSICIEVLYDVLFLPIACRCFVQGENSQKTQFILRLCEKVFFLL